MQRRLTTIVAADVAEYSRLIGLDEEGTLAALRGHREALIDPLLEQYGGRVANTAGDSLLIEFPSAVEAVRCAIAVQEGMVERNANIPEDQRIEFRVGINVGDVVDQDGDLLGDGVNIAARLEAQAPPGGIVLSRSVRDQVRDRMDLDLADLGEIEVKNIARPVRAFQVVGDGEIARSLPSGRSLRRVSWYVAALVLVVAGAAGWWRFGAENEPAEIDPILALPTGPKIVVLPFDNLSGDPDQDYFVDGLVEDLTTRLTEHGYLYVIARNSAFKYKGKSPDVRDVGVDLGVDYVVEGSVRRSGDRIRVNAQLLDAHDGTHIWARTYDRDFDVAGLFGIQDELTTPISRAVGEVKGAISQTLLKGMEAKRPKDIASYECVLL